MIIDDLIEFDDYRSSYDKNFALKDAVKFYIPDDYPLYSSDNSYTDMNTLGLVSKLPYQNICLIFHDYILFVHEVTNSPLEYSYYSDALSIKDAKAMIRVIKTGRGEIFDTNLILISKFDGQSLNYRSAFYDGEFDTDYKYVNSDYVHKDKNQIVHSLELTTARHLITLNKFLSFLSCKNIKSTLYNPPEKIQKKRLKNNKLPLFSYRTLVLDTSKNDQNIIEPQELWTNRVHLCRGHVSRYGPKYGNKKLFGKYEGLYWIPPHVRGNKSKGVIHKDYKFVS
jgi:hypothetical protein